MKRENTMQSAGELSKGKTDQSREIIEGPSGRRGGWSAQKDAKIQEPDASSRGKILELARKVTINSNDEDRLKVYEAYKLHTFSLGYKELENITFLIKENIEKSKDLHDKYDSAIKEFNEKFSEERYSDIIEKCNRINNDTDLRVQMREDIHDFLRSTNPLLIAATQETIDKIVSGKDSDGTQLGPGDSRREYHHDKFQAETANYTQTRSGQVLVEDMDINFSLESTKPQQAAIPEQLVQYDLAKEEEALYTDSSSEPQIGPGHLEDFVQAKQARHESHDNWDQMGSPYAEKWFQEKGLVHPWNYAGQEMQDVHVTFKSVTLTLGHIKRAYREIFKTKDQSFINAMNAISNIQMKIENISNAFRFSELADKDVYKAQIEQIYNDLTSNALNPTHEYRPGEAVSGTERVNRHIKTVLDGLQDNKILPQQDREEPLPSLSGSFFTFTDVQPQRNQPDLISTRDHMHEYQLEWERVTGRYKGLWGDIADNIEQQQNPADKLDLKITETIKDKIKHIEHRFYISANSYQKSDTSREDQKYKFIEQIATYVKHIHDYMIYSKYNTKTPANVITSIHILKAINQDRRNQSSDLHKLLQEDTTLRLHISGSFDDLEIALENNSNNSLLKE